MEKNNDIEWNVGPIEPNGGDVHNGVREVEQNGNIDLVRSPNPKKSSTDEQETQLVNS